MALLRDRTGSPDPGHPKEKDESFWQPSRPDTREGCISRPPNPLVQPAVEGLRASGHQGLGGGRGGGALLPLTIPPPLPRFATEGEHLVS